MVLVTMMVVWRTRAETYLPAVDCNGAMDHKLPGLSDATGKHGSEHCGIEPSLQRGVDHLHVRNWRCALFGLVKLGAHASPSGLDAAVVGCKVLRIHGDYGTKTPIEHSGPDALADL